MLFGLIEDPQAFLMQLLINLPAILFSLSFHEAAHAYAAYRCGDPTAYMLGRLTLNPIKHMDPLGLLSMLLLGMGWAKPVPVNPRNFKSYRRDDLIVSIAGITANMILFVAALIVIFFTLWIQVATRSSSPAVGYAMEMLYAFVTVNLTLAFFNLIPIPPLDGYHVLNDLALKRPLFTSQQASYAGMALLLILNRTGLISRYLNFIHLHILWPIINLMSQFFASMALA